MTESVQLLKSLQITEKRDETLPTDDVVLPSPTEEALEDLLSIIPQVIFVYVHFRVLITFQGKRKLNLTVRRSVIISPTQMIGFHSGQSDRVLLI